jgi:putative transposase
MKFNPQKHKRSSIRLKNYDYTSKGAYFLTICSYEKSCLFGDILNEEIVLNKIGEIAYRQWLDIPKRFSYIEIDEFVIMPNHLHGILIIKNDDEGHSTLLLNCAPTKNQQITGNLRQYGEMIPGSFSTIVRTYKSLTSRYINLCLNSKGKRI